MCTRHNVHIHIAVQSKHQQGVKMTEISELEAQTLKSYEMRDYVDSLPIVTILNKEFAIHRDVYHPSISMDMTEYISEVLDKTIEEELAKRSSFDFLEVGCGAGYTSVLVALSSDKCRVWATDINEAAVANAKHNSKLHGVENKVKAVVADVFNNEEIIGRKFDMIYWNLPWTGQSTDKDAKVATLLYSVLDPGYRSLMRFLNEASDFLKEQGRVIVAFSFSLGSEELFRSVASKTGWKVKILSSKEFPYELAGVTHNHNVVIVEFLK